MVQLNYKLDVMLLFFFLVIYFISRTYHLSNRIRYFFIKYIEKGNNLVVNSHNFIPFIIKVKIFTKFKTIGSYINDTLKIKILESDRGLYLLVSSLEPLSGDDIIIVNDEYYKLIHIATYKTVNIHLFSDDTRELDTINQIKEGVLH